MEQKRRMITDNKNGSKLVVPGSLIVTFFESEIKKYLLSQQANNK